MAGRLSEEPWGGARFAYAYLAAFLSLIGAALVGVIAYPILGASGACQADGSGYCLPATTGLVVFVGLAGCLVLAGWFIRLGWQWACWVIVLTLVVGQLTVQANNFYLALVAVLIPALAALITFRRPDRQPGRTGPVIRLVALGVVAAQFIVWFALLAAGA